MTNCRGILKHPRALLSFMGNATLTRFQSPAQSGHSLWLRFGRPLHTSAFREADKPAAESTTEKEKGGENVPLRDRLKSVVAEYGTTAVVFHVTISLTSLGLCYIAVKSGIDVQAALQFIGVSSSVADSSVATEASTFVVAYAFHKVFAPLRMFMTISCTPLIVRKLRKMGILKEPLRQ